MGYYLNKIFLNISSNPTHLESGINSIQIVFITSFVIILNVGIKKIDCSKHWQRMFLWRQADFHH